MYSIVPVIGPNPPESRYRYRYETILFGISTNNNLTMMLQSQYEFRFNVRFNIKTFLHKKENQFLKENSDHQSLLAWRPAPPDLLCHFSSFSSFLCYFLSQIAVGLPRAFRASESETEPRTARGSHVFSPSSGPPKNQSDYKCLCDGRRQSISNEEERERPEQKK